MSSENCCVSWDFLSGFITDACECAGVPREDAAICADVLLEADRRGIKYQKGVTPFYAIMNRINADYNSRLWNRNFKWK